MQYKIPVQIENEDPIIFGLSLRQITIIMIWWGLWYSITKSLSESVEPIIAWIPAVIILTLSVFIAVFKYYEMSFLKFVFAFIRYKVNISERKWIQSIDSFWALDIGYITTQNKMNKKVDFSDKLSKIKKIDEQLEKI